MISRISRTGNVINLPGALTSLSWNFETQLWLRVSRGISRTSWGVPFPSSTFRGKKAAKEMYIFALTKTNLIFARALFSFLPSSVFVEWLDLKTPSVFIVASRRRTTPPVILLFPRCKILPRCLRLCSLARRDSLPTPTDLRFFLPRNCFGRAEFSILFLVERLCSSPGSIWKLKGRGKFNYFH